MKRWWVWLVVALAVASVGGAAYLGFSSVQAKEIATPQSPVTVAVTRGDVQQSVTAPGILVSPREVTLGTGTGGQLAQVYVRPGDEVQAGDVMAELKIDDLLAQIAQAKTDLALAKLRLSEAEKSLEQQIAQKEIDLAAAQARLAQAEDADASAVAQAEWALAVAQEQLDRLRVCREDYAAQVVTARVDLARAEDELRRAQIEDQKARDRHWEPQEVRDAYARALQQAGWNHESAQARYDQALAAQEVYRHDLNLQRMAVDQAEAELVWLRQGVDPLLAFEIQRARQELAWLREGVDPVLASEVDQVQLALDHLLAQVVDAQIVAPTGGIVMEVMVRPGDAVAEGTALILMTDLAAVEARTTVIEEDLPLVQVGQTVDLFFDARPDVAIQGRVTHIVPRRESGSDRPLYPVYITPDELPEGLALGMTVDASIITAGRLDVLRLPRTLVRARPDGTAEVKVWVDGAAETRTVQVGLRGDIYVEIVDGLHEGQEVVGQ
jgi:multidrug efflux pump subunit AcrA (membrane-fusion protein)